MCIRDSTHTGKERGNCFNKSLTYGQFTLSYLYKATTVSFTSCFAPLSQKKRIALLNSITEANNEVVCVMRSLVVMWKVIMSHLFLYGEASFLLIILFYFPGTNSFINSVLSHSLTNTAPKLLFIHLHLLLANLKTYYSCFFLFTCNIKNSFECFFSCLWVVTVFNTTERWLETQCSPMRSWFVRWLQIQMV